MRPPRCFLRYIAAALEAEHELLASLTVHTAHLGPGHRASVQLTQARRKLDDLLEHIGQCEECESP